MNEKTRKNLRVKELRAMLLLEDGLAEYAQATSVYDSFEMPEKIFNHFEIIDERILANLTDAINKRKNKLLKHY